MSDLSQVGDLRKVATYDAIRPRPRHLVNRRLRASTPSDVARQKSKEVPLPDGGEKKAVRMIKVADGIYDVVDMGNVIRIQRSLPDRRHSDWFTLIPDGLSWEFDSDFPIRRAAIVRAQQLLLEARTSTAQNLQRAGCGAAASDAAGSKGR